MTKYMAERAKRTEWFRQDRFGLFIHWGLYSILGRDAWVHSDEKIPCEAYQKHFEDWNPVDFNPVEWAKLAKVAGMKYAVLTTKHHEGFCLFDTKLSDYSSTKTSYGRDIVREFVDAFRAEGLKVGFYYSLLDWKHEDYTAFGDLYHPERENEKRSCHSWNKYLDYLHGQIHELMSNYGKIDILWLDFSYEGHMGEDWEGAKLVEMVRRLQPDIIINGRLEANGESYGSVMTDEPNVFSGDFACPEMFIPSEGLITPKGEEIPWEACATMNNSWGYAPFDHNYKSLEQIIRMLVECTSKNGNLLLNISPDARGKIPKKQIEILNGIAEWMEDNAESIYACGKSTFEKPEWGRFTQRGKYVYAHVFEASTGALALPGLQGKIKKANRLFDGLEMCLSTPWVAKEYSGYAFLNFARPEYFFYKVEESIDTVIKLELFDEDEEV